ncbi:MAG TPA: hypothetical protein PLX06_09060 [Fimbriimonadaceae bacterium]|nr:hypothetical protein [Fimbriimonadaceae bacterium]
MECALCGNALVEPSDELNRLELDDGRSVLICTACIDRFLKWQGARIAKLFPTSALKRRFNR